MTLKILTATFALIAVPMFALASPMGCSGEHKTETAMSCAEGMMIDEATGTCVPVVSS